MILRDINGNTTSRRGAYISTLIRAQSTPAFAVDSTGLYMVTVGNDGRQACFRADDAPAMVGYVESNGICEHRG